MSGKFKRATLAIVKYILYRTREGKFFGNCNSVKLMFDYYSDSLVKRVFDSLLEIGFLIQYKGEFVSFYYINRNKLPCEMKDLKSVMLPKDIAKGNEARCTPKDDCMFHRLRGCYGARS